MTRWTRLRSSPPLICLVISSVVLALLLLLRAVGSLEFLELAAYDIYLRLQPRVSDADRRIVVVGVTEADLQTYGYPLPDGTLTDLLRRLNTYQPYAIGLDIYRDIPVPPGHARLEAFLKDNQNVISVMLFGDEGEGRVAPPPVLENTDQVGTADVPIDPSGIVRRALLFLDDDTTVVYSFPLRLALHYLAAHGVQPRPAPDNPRHIQLGKVILPPFEPDDGGYVNADLGGYQMLLDFAGAPQAGFRRYSVADVLNDRVEPQAVSNKIVIVGMAADSVKDYFYTPLSGGPGTDQYIFGITLHAHTVSQLLRSGLDGAPPIAVLDDKAEAAWIGLWTLFGGLMGLWVRSVRRFATVAAVSLAALMLACYGAFSQHWWIPAVPPGLGLLLAAGLVTSYMSSQEKAQRAVLMQLFSRYIPSSVAESLWQQREQFLEGGRPLPQRLMATVLFSDLRGFTSVSEQMDPRALMDWLNVYMETMARIVMQHGGVVDKFIGDAIMAVFGVPLPRLTEAAIAQDAVHAVDCAVAMEKALDRLNLEWQAQGLPVIGIRVGIFTGPLVAGSLGSSERMEYTAIGDTVNIASRLESLASESLDKTASGSDAPQSACRILIGETTMQYLRGKYPTHRVGAVRLKGKHETITVFRVLTQLVTEVSFPAQQEAT